MLPLTSALLDGSVIIQMPSSDGGKHKLGATVWLFILIYIHAFGHFSPHYPSIFIWPIIYSLMDAYVFLMNHFVLAPNLQIYEI